MRVRTRVCGRKNLEKNVPENACSIPKQNVNDSPSSRMGFHVARSDRHSGGIWRSRNGCSLSRRSEISHKVERKDMTWLPNKGRNKTN